MVSPLAFSVVVHFLVFVSKSENHKVTHHDECKKPHTPIGSKTVVKVTPQLRSLDNAVKPVHIGSYTCCTRSLLQSYFIDCYCFVHNYFQIISFLIGQYSIHTAVIVLEERNHLINRRLNILCRFIGGPSHQCY